MARKSLAWWIIVWRRWIHATASSQPNTHTRLPTMVHPIIIEIPYISSFYSLDYNYRVFFLVVARDGRDGNCEYGMGILDDHDGKPFLFVEGVFF